MPVASKKRLLIRPEDVPPSREDWEVVGAFNPAAVLVDGRVVLLVRVAERPREARPGYVALPRWTADRGPVVDWLEAADVEAVDPRVVRVAPSGLVRLTFTSHLRVVYCGDGERVDRLGSVFAPQEAFEAYGVEDPRITWIDGRYWFTYVAVSRHGAATALASTDDFQHFQRHGVIFPPENKDVVLFPERIGGRYAALHRPNGATPFTMPEMWVARSDDLVHWGGHEPLFSGHADWEDGRVGAGTPPVRLEEGWLEIYHGSRRPRRAGEVGRYEAAAMLLEADNPASILQRTDQPILTPSERYEREGFVPDVVFPTGIVQRGDSLLVYYGAGDTCTAVVEMSLADVNERLQAGAETS